jgi:hypothetical protein
VPTRHSQNAGPRRKGFCQNLEPFLVAPAPPPFRPCHHCDLTHPLLLSVLSRAFLRAGPYLTTRRVSPDAYFHSNVPTAAIRTFHDGPDALLHVRAEEIDGVLSVSFMFSDRLHDPEEAALDAVRSFAATECCKHHGPPI